MQPAPTSIDATEAGRAAKRLRMDEVLQHHAPREQMLVSELMGWRSSSQGPLSSLGTGAMPSGSTDFRALFARQALQQNLAPQRAPCAATTGLRTFADVAFNSSAPTEDVMRCQVLGALRAAYNSTGVSTSSELGRSISQHPWPGLQDAAGGSVTTGLAPSSVAAAAVGSGLEDLAPEQLPVDWAIKRSVTFISSARFAIHENAQQAPPRTRLRALQNVVKNDLDTNGDKVLQYLSCQISWRHPEMPMDAPALAAARLASFAAPTGGGGGSALANAIAGSLSGGGGGLFAQRLAAWRSALHSLYGTYRGGDCNIFYVISSAARYPCVAMFAHKGVRGSGDLCAVVSQSTRVLRSRMLAAGVPFIMPLERSATGPNIATGNGAGPGTSGKVGYEAGPDAHEDGDASLCDEGPQGNPSSVGAPPVGYSVGDNSRESLLLLRGPRGVHGLYDFLLNEISFSGFGGRAPSGGAGAGEELSDLPLLLAPVPFDGGAVWRPAVKALTLNSKLAGDSASDLGAAAMLPPPSGAIESESGSVMHVLQVSGILPPWTVRRLCSLMARLQPSGYHATMETEPSSITLNSRVVEALPGNDSDGRSAVAAQQLQPTVAQGGALTLEELFAWQQPAILPLGRPVKGVTCNGTHRLSVRV